jgi:hypothetical protein
VVVDDQHPDRLGHAWTLAVPAPGRSVETRRVPACGTDGTDPIRAYRAAMRFTLPVIWSHEETTRAGLLEASEERVTLSAREGSFAFGLDSVETFTIERGPTERIRGLPALCVRLAGGDVVRIASMGGAGSLHELSALLGRRQPAVNGTCAATVVPEPGDDSISSVPPTRPSRSRMPTRPSASSRTTA